MLIHQDFTGGNIRVEKQEGNVVYLNNELRDTGEDWFYWAFCVEGAAGKTVTFRFPPVRLGYFGPAISHDLKTWEWLGAGAEQDAFTYSFGEREDKVYFAHNMLYHPDRFYAFAEKHGLKPGVLCKSRKGRNVPFLSFGEGERIILLTARHHACESTGSYVLEGVLEGLLAKPVKNTRVICVPFVDFDGVLDGDQGKSRIPHDQNRDYVPDESSIYPEVREIRKIAAEGILYGFDFHSPWHMGGKNDLVYVIQKKTDLIPEYERFSAVFESSVTKSALQYDRRNDFPPEVDWNRPDTPCFAVYMLDQAKAKLAFTLETAYFGTGNNIFSQKNAVELGRCFAEGIRKYDSDMAMITFTGDLMCSQNMTEKTKEDYGVLFEQIRDTLKNSDYLVGNCETPVAGKELGYTDKQYSFNTPESYLGALKACGFDLLALANNHAMDRGEEGILKTLGNCRKYGFDTIGIYDSKQARDTVFVKTLGRIRVAFVNYTYGINAFAHHLFLKHSYMVNLYQPEETREGAIHLLNTNAQIAQDVENLYCKKNRIFDQYVSPYLERLREDIQKAKKEADFVIMVSHCGGQYNEEVDAYTKYIHQLIKEWGADVIVGNHPHIIQKCDRTDGYLTVYSLGNFVCDFVSNDSLHFANNQIDPSYSALLHLYLFWAENGVNMKAGFQILKTVVDHDGIPQPVDAYELYRKTDDKTLKDEILYFANRFANTDAYQELRKVYPM